MDTKNKNLTLGAVQHLRQTHFLRMIEVSNNFVSAWIGGAVQLPSKVLRTASRDQSNVGRNRRAIRELNRMSDYQLADIGLSRSDLTLDGLAVASAKRALKQKAVASEHASSRKNWGGN